MAAAVDGNDDSGPCLWRFVNELASRPRKPVFLKTNAAQQQFSLTGVGLRIQFQLNLMNRILLSLLLLGMADLPLPRATACSTILAGTHVTADGSVLRS
jgi:hypothetical protein